MIICGRHLAIDSGWSNSDSNWRGQLCLTCHHLANSRFQDRRRAEQYRVERERQLELLRQEQNEERRREREEAVEAKRGLMEKMQQDSGPFQTMLSYPMFWKHVSRLSRLGRLKDLGQLLPRTFDMFLVRSRRSKAPLEMRLTPDKATLTTSYDILRPPFLYLDFSKKPGFQ